MSMLQVVILHYKVEKLQLEKYFLLCIVVESIGIREIKHRAGKREIQVEKF